MNISTSSYLVPLHFDRVLVLCVYCIAKLSLLIVYLLLYVLLFYYFSLFFLSALLGSKHFTVSLNLLFTKLVAIVTQGPSDPNVAGDLPPSPRNNDPLNVTSLSLKIIDNLEGQ
jgi:hypothetical protein